MTSHCYGHSVSTTLSFGPFSGTIVNQALFSLASDLILEIQVRPCGIVLLTVTATLHDILSTFLYGSCIWATKSTSSTGKIMEDIQVLSSASEFSQFSLSHNAQAVGLGG